MKTAPVLFFSMLFLAPAACRALEVLYDSGQTRPLAPLLEQAGLLVRQAPAVQPPPPPSPPDPLRVSTPALTPGPQPRVPLGPARGALPRPLFLVGADPLSLAWLQKHRERLKEIGAVGLIIEAPDGDAVRRMRQAGAGLTMGVGSGADLAWLFSLQHYPVLIGARWIEQ